NLKKDDIDSKNNRLILNNEANNSGRFLYVSDRTIHLLEKAMDEKTYRKRNGLMKSTPFNNVRDYTDLVDNDYVLRASITKTEGYNKPVDKFVIYRRIEAISKNLGIEDLTAKFIQRSGMIHFAHQYMKNGEISLDNMKD